MSDEAKPVTEDPKALAEYLVRMAVEAHVGAHSQASFEEALRERMNNAAQTITNEVELLRNERQAAIDELNAVRQALGADAGRSTLEAAIELGRRVVATFDESTKQRLRAERAEALAAEERERGHEALRKGMAVAQKKHDAMRAAEAGLAALHAAAKRVRDLVANDRDGLSDPPHITAPKAGTWDFVNAAEDLRLALADTAAAAEAYTQRVRAEGEDAARQAALDALRAWRADGNRNAPIYAPATHILDALRIDTFYEKLLRARAAEIDGGR